MSLAAPTLAYDLELLKVPPARGTATDHGWCLGLPPGITESNGRSVRMTAFRCSHVSR